MLPLSEPIDFEDTLRHRSWNSEGRHKQGQTTVLMHRQETNLQVLRLLKYLKEDHSRQKLFHRDHPAVEQCIRQHIAMQQYGQLLRGNPHIH